MRLDRIKLAGFKSFVDPTTIPTPGNLIGIVGPNGCGKSNIIDAVRWVMGESSAKHLRGESMADVIFNGSSSRKPVGLASVELVFDNGEGKAPGEFANYPEISIKRQVTRDGQSTYILNGTRCRRKDITDLFLGTGLGSRSYAIIEQGTISRLIEAKPAELRELIEEAAGISKYKERRHETELRMGHTQENLDRLLDVRDEVGKQLESLKRQAKKAEKYMALKVEERGYREQLLGLRWRKYDEEFHSNQEQLAECETRFRALAGEDHALNETLEAQRAQQDAVQKVLNAEQGRFYELGSEISRLTQSIRHARETHENLLQEESRLREEQQQAEQDLENDRLQLETLREELAEIEMTLEEARKAEAEAAARRGDADLGLKTARQQFEQLSEAIGRSRSQRDIQQSRIGQLEQQARQLLARQEKLAMERQEVEVTLNAEGLAELELTLAELDAERSVVHEALQGLNQRILTGREELKNLQHALNARRSEQHALSGKISSLETLQEHAMGKDRAGLRRWLAEQQLEQAPRLAQQLDVQPGWETAVETALGAQLQALCVEETARFIPLLGGLAEESLSLFETRPPAIELQDRMGSRLLERVNSPWNLTPLLGAVYCVDDLAAAHDLSTEIAEHESVITPDGTRLGPGWLTRQKLESGQAGVIKRERELKTMKAGLKQLLGQIGGLEQQLHGTEMATREAEHERERRQADERRLNAEHSRARAELSATQARCEQSSRRLGQISAELTDLEEQLTEQREDIEESRRLRLEAEDRLTELELAAAEHANSRDSLESRLTETDAALRQARDRVSTLRSRAESLRSSEQLTSRHLERIRSQLDLALQRLATLSRRVADIHQPTGDSQAELDALTDQKTAVEKKLAELRHRAAELEAELRRTSEARLRNERVLNGIKERLEQIRLELSANSVRRQTVQEQFEELGADPASVVAGLPDDADESLWQTRLSELGEEISRLGAVNLTAREEYLVQEERLAFLDQQHEDLSVSLATLREAIETIDKECRSRFKDTFELINTGLQQMFPKLFGGGHACLELTERDLLESGVTVMARPPGKRNSSIHLLSGGEKALTAAALVFAIFELNPAPFCLLDEVDAPLDDANVGRFSELVKEMSERVQFLFISHNKVTMEIAHHLAGVTMKEPGVSRIVAVDIDAAVELAAL
ncbi:MAG: chromosome segregation protein SMC [Methylococcaceae bacterium]|nr:chromosome segregation protein SMC [Methylococcaceae bacterium]